MKKNFLTVAALAVVAFFVSTEIAKATDVTFSGQIRTRWEVNEQGNAAGNGAGSNNAFDNNPDDFIFTSTRLAAKANINETTSGFIQMQSTRTWGQVNGGTAETQNGGSGNASGTVNDNDSSVGVHQAYFTFKNFLNLPLGFDAKVGRQELLLDGWRLFGNTIWTPGMQSHDGATFLHKHDNISLLLGYILAVENDRLADPNDSTDREVVLSHLNVKGVLGGQFSGYFVYDSNDSAAGAQTRDNHFWTIGGRQAGNMGGLDYRGEFYYQWGAANGQKDGNVATDADRQAYMYGLRLGKTFKNVSFKPGLTIWYDYLSGTSDDDQRNGEWHSFNTLYDTGHKYYGLLDVFLGVGFGGNSGTQGLGLQDFALKYKMNPMAGWTLKADYHWFWTAESVAANTTTRGFANVSSAGEGGLDNFLGNELDITAVNKFNANTKVMIGYSNYNPSTSFSWLKDTGAPSGSGGTLYGTSDANWAYVQIDVKF